MHLWYGAAPGPRADMYAYPRGVLRGPSRPAPLVGDGVDRGALEQAMDLRARGGEGARDGAEVAFVLGEQREQAVARGVATGVGGSRRGGLEPEVGELDLGAGVDRE